MFLLRLTFSASNNFYVHCSLFFFFLKVNYRLKKTIVCCNDDASRRIRCYTATITLLHTYVIVSA